MSPNDEAVVAEVAYEFAKGVGGVRNAGELRLLLLDIQQRLSALPGQLDRMGQSLLDAYHQAPAVQAQAIADALGPDLGAQVLAALKARL